MYESWGRIVGKLRWVIVAVAIAFVAFAGIWGTSVFGKLSGTTSLDDPSSESQRITAQINHDFGNQTVDVIGLYSSTSMTADQPAFRAAVEGAVAKARADQYVTKVVDYYSSGNAALVSTDQHATYVTVQLVQDRPDGTLTALKGLLQASGSSVSTQIGGQAIVDDDIGSEIPGDIGKAEGIAGPLLLIALLFVFGSVVAACMPLMIGAVAVMGAFLLVRVVTMFTEVSIFSINIITILGLGLAIDYGLFVVNRFREELRKNDDVEQALARTVGTAGRTVTISGLLVALALLSLTMFPQVFLRSMGIGGAAAVLFAMVCSLTLLPATLSILGHRVNAGRLPWARRRLTTAAITPHDESIGKWGRIAAAVMRRPVVFLVGVVAVLAVLAVPFLSVHFGGDDERMLPAGTQSRVVAEKLADEFPHGTMRPIRVLVSDASPAAAADFANRIEQVPNAGAATVAAQRPDATLLLVSYTGDASSVQARNIASDIRGLAPPSGATVMVGGTPAAVVDQLHSLSSRLPWMFLLVAGVTFILLSIGFGSIVVPLKAIVMNLVSICAAFGVVTWIFQDGHLSGLFGFTPTGYVEASQPVLMIAILFGLSMDYEVFLLSRIREHYDETGDNSAAIVRGVQRTGWMISTAALLLCIVVGFFALSGITFIKMIGVGMVVALLIDATLVRLVLVPVTMRLLGRLNWAAPPVVRRLYGRFGIREELPHPAPVIDRTGELTRV